VHCHLGHVVFGLGGGVGVLNEHGQWGVSDCTVAVQNIGVFSFAWTLSPGLTFSQAE
jgi:hypothetical protein